VSFAFFEGVIDPDYAPDAEGGPEFGNRVFQSPDSGLESVTIGRTQARHRYTIDYQLLTAASQKGLRDFFYALGGMQTGFRFFAPDDNLLDNELIDTGDGSEATYNIIKTYIATASGGYGGASRSYVRRIVKPAADSFVVTVAGTSIPLVSGTPGAGQARVNFTTGVITFGSAPASGAQIRVTGTFHVPVRFASDYFNPRYDVSAELSNLELLELLPQTLGIT
jgi:uncharacterized protein (TIGR02217 family)